ncbi:uncharacterized protein LOC100382396 [Zea mays]|uniref:Uncharacterized protein n=1 Tax=Zea mays TaxID=4577 RepID=C0P788_MAIZE|nr:uncharacterized protein LOC100382396 [Zea mays]ACN28854.1 unknown [Zea mays]|eukprot:NP_001168612.1 uncharacterized protein LOC100382396 [Zea mays]
MARMLLAGAPSAGAPSAGAATSTTAMDGSPRQQRRRRVASIGGGGYRAPAAVGRLGFPCRASNRPCTSVGSACKAQHRLPSPSLLRHSWVGP